MVQEATHRAHRRGWIAAGWLRWAGSWRRALGVKLHDVNKGLWYLRYLSGKCLQDLTMLSKQGSMTSEGLADLIRGWQRHTRFHGELRSAGFMLARSYWGRCKKLCQNTAGRWKLTNALPVPHSPPSRLFRESNVCKRCIASSTTVLTPITDCSSSSPSRRCYRSFCTRNSGFRISFFPASLTLLNSTPRCLSKTMGRSTSPK